MARRYIVMALGCWALPMAIMGLSACINIDISLFRGDDTPTVRIDNARFEVEVVDTELLRRRGLTGRQYLEERKGMLFIPDGPDAGRFWMKGMLFPLDFIWIGSDCWVVDVSVYAKIPDPGTPDDRIRRYSSYPRAAYTLEVNAGEADRFGIRVGDKAKFENIDDHC